jgi:hypothetical protein
MQAIKEYAQVIDGSFHVKLPKNFTAKLVELIICLLTITNQVKMIFFGFCGKAQK